MQKAFVTSGAVQYHRARIEDLFGTEYINRKVKCMRHKPPSTKPRGPHAHAAGGFRQQHGGGGGVITAGLSAVAIVPSVGAEAEITCSDSSSNSSGRRLWRLWG